MSAFDEIENPKSESFVCPEGFARITRDGLSDIFVVQNQEYPGNYKVSLGFSIDDNSSQGEPIIVMASDKVEYLGSTLEYFDASSPFGDMALALVREFPQEWGLLPIVRIVESLKNRTCSHTDVAILVSTAKEDYKRRVANLLV